MKKYISYWWCRLHRFNIVPDLLQMSKVTVIDNFMFGQSSLNHCCSNPNFKIVNGDIRHESFIIPYYNSSQIIIPLAGYVGAPICNKDLTGAQSVNHDAIMLMLNSLNDDQIVLMQRPIVHMALAKMIICVMRTHHLIQFQNTP